MSESISAPGKFWDRRQIRKVIDFLLAVSVGFSLVLILARALPYGFIKEIRFPFIELETSLYMAAVLFIIRQAIEPLSKTRELFSRPVNRYDGSHGSYRKHDVLICVLIFLFSAAYLLVLFNKHVPNHDEGWILTMADRVSKRDVPYKDFFLLPTPMGIYLNSWFFRLFGSSIVTERAITLVLAAVTSSMIYLLARLGMGYFFSVGASLLALAWQFPTLFHASYSWYATFFSIASFLVMGLSAKGENRSGVKIFLVGLLCGTSFVSKQNMGAMTLIALATYLLAERVFLRVQSKRGFLYPFFPWDLGIEKPIDVLKEYAILFLGFMIPLGLCAYTFFAKGYMMDFLEGVFIMPFRTAGVYFTSYPPLWPITDRKLMSYMPHFMILISLGVFLKRFPQASLHDGGRFPLLLVMATSFTYFTVYPRAHYAQIAFCIWPSLILLAYWIQRSVISVSDYYGLSLKQNPGPSLSRVRRINLAVVFFSVSVFTAFFIHRTDKNISLKNNLVEIDARKGQGIYGKRREVEELNELIRVIDTRKDRCEAGAIFSTYPLVYYLTDLVNPTPYDYILAGNGPVGYEREILDILKSRKPCLIVIDNNYPARLLPEGWGMIRDYIYKRYDVIYHSDYHSVLERNGVSLTKQRQDASFL